MKLHDPTDMIFVFGSNLSGIHGAGAARYARNNKWAVYGVGEGLTGQSYALPTKGHNITQISLDEVHSHVQKFMKFSYDQRGAYEFQVTRVGTGLSGFSNKEMAEMFHYVAYAASNCYFDVEWKNFLPSDTKFWGTG